MPPLQGPRAIECCTRKPVKISILPVSMVTGKCTMTSRVGVRSSFHKPSSRLSLRAAKSNRAFCASQGLISWSNVILGVTPAIDLSHSRNDRIVRTTAQKGPYAPVPTQEQLHWASEFLIPAHPAQPQTVSCARQRAHIGTGLPYPGRRPGDAGLSIPACCVARARVFHAGVSRERRAGGPLHLHRAGAVQAHRCRSEEHTSELQS